MNQVTLVDIPFKVDFAAVLKHAHVRPDSSESIEIERLVLEADAIARPKAAYQVSSVEPIDDRHILMDGITFTSRVLRVNLDGLHRVFPYIATCGMELQQWSDSISDMLVSFWADLIKAMALSTAISAMSLHLQMHYMPGSLASMNPGSLPDWPLSEQRPFFHLFGAAAETLGISLSSSCLMTPNKSVTGVQFAVEHVYENCQLCPREDCPGRRAPYDEKLLSKYDLVPNH